MQEEAWHSLGADQGSRKSGIIQFAATVVILDFYRKVILVRGSKMSWQSPKSYNIHHIFPRYRF